MQANLRSGKATQPRQCSLSILWRLLSFLHGLEGWVALSVLLGVATTAMGIGLIATSAYLISMAALQPSIAVLEVAIVGVRFFGLSRGIFRYLERLVSHSANFRLLARLRVWFYDAVEPLAPAWLLFTSGGDLLTRSTADIDVLENFYIRVVSPPMVCLIVLVGMSLFIGSYTPKLIWLLVAAFIAEGVGLPLLMGALSRKSGAEWVQTRAQLMTFLIDGMHGLADLLAFGAEHEKKDRLADLDNHFVRIQKRLARIAGLQNGLTALINDLSGWVVLIYVIHLVSQQQLAPTLMAMLLLGILASFEAVNPLPVAAQNLESSLEAGRRIFEVAKLQPAVVDPQAPSPSPSSFDLVVEHLSFRYPEVPLRLSDFNSYAYSSASASVPASESGSIPDSYFQLQDVSFRLSQGEHLALVGSNGAGKSTLIHLLMRYWDYTEGNISLGGRELKTYRQENVHHWFGLISQSTYLFDGTLRQNLMLANPTASTADLMEVIQQVQLGELLAQLPRGLDTWIGEHGLRLSGGEKQRLAIARAMQQNTPILLLDEPTKNLDPVNAESILQLILNLNRNKSLLWITHQFNRLDLFDGILVLQGGRVVEQGVHSDLWQAQGLYRQLWNLQQGILG